MAAVIEESVHGFLEHALFVADNDFRRLELQQVFQPVVPVDDAAIKVVEVGGSETATFERNEWTQVRRNDRQHGEDHPFRAALGGLESLEQLDALGDLLADLLALGFGHGRLQMLDLLGQIDAGQGVADSFCAHLGLEGFDAVGLARFAIFVFAKKLVLLEWGRARIDDHVILVVNDALKVASGHVEDQADARRHALEEPDMANWHRQFDMAHALATDAGESDLNAAPVADDTSVL